MSTYIPSGKDIERKWYVIDAEGQTLGRLASQAASILAGKTNPKYTPFIDMGHHVIVINAEKIKVTGMKAGYLDLLGIDHDDVMAHVDKRRVFRIRFAGENTRGLAGKAAERLPLGIYHVPLALDILATRDVS